MDDTQFLDLLEKIEHRLDNIDKKQGELSSKMLHVENSIRSDIAEFRAEVNNNYVAIGDTITQAIEETEKRLSQEISDMKHAIAQNSYDIAVVRGKSG